MAFDIENFLPYLLNRAAEHASWSFQSVYKSKYGMLREEWRVLFHIGFYDKMTASEICKIGGLHKTKVSRAVTALEKKRYIERSQLEADKRFAPLQLTKTGREVYRDLSALAEREHHQMMADFSDEEQAVLLKCLHHLRGPAYLEKSG
jgi:DNA-binding MarR family transcriptional regulator